MGLCTRTGTEPIPLGSRLCCFILLRAGICIPYFVDLVFRNFIMLPPVNLILVSNEALQCVS